MTYYHVERFLLVGTLAGSFSFLIAASPQAQTELCKKTSNTWVCIDDDRWKDRNKFTCEDLCRLNTVTKPTTVLQNEPIGQSEKILVEVNKIENQDWTENFRELESNQDINFDQGDIYTTVTVDFQSSLNDEGSCADFSSSEALINRIFGNSSNTTATMSLIVAQTERIIDANFNVNGYHIPIVQLDRSTGGNCTYTRTEVRDLNIARLRSDQDLRVAVVYSFADDIEVLANLEKVASSALGGVMNGVIAQAAPLVKDVLGESFIRKRSDDVNIDFAMPLSPSEEEPAREIIARFPGAGNQEIKIYIRQAPELETLAELEKRRVLKPALDHATVAERTEGSLSAQKKTLSEVLVTAGLDVLVRSDTTLRTVGDLCTSMRASLGKYGMTDVALDHLMALVLRAYLNSGAPETSNVGKIPEGRVADACIEVDRMENGYFFDLIFPDGQSDACVGNDRWVQDVAPDLHEAWANTFDAEALLKNRTIEFGFDDPLLSKYIKEGQNRLQAHVSTWESYRGARKGCYLALRAPSIQLEGSRFNKCDMAYALFLGNPQNDPAVWAQVQRKPTATELENVIINVDPMEMFNVESALSDRERDLKARGGNPETDHCVAEYRRLLGSEKPVVAEAGQ